MRMPLVATLAAALLTLAPLPSRSGEADAPAPATAGAMPAAANADPPAATAAPEAAAAAANADAPAAPAKGDAPAATAKTDPPAAEAKADAAKAPAKADGAARARPEAGEEIVVTATRSPRPIASLPVAVKLVSREDVERSPTKTVDELLRMDPSFALFRRSSSIAADPSSQGVKLRGVGTSGVSRTLVLVDGIPVNDPFGGWVAWRSMPRAGIESIEIVPGGGSALYGNYALGGVIQVLSRPIADREVELTSEAGAMGTALVGGEVMDRRGPIRTSAEGEFLSTQGYPVMATYSRGSIDGDTPSKHAAMRARLEADATGDLSFGLRGGFFWEDLNGGTQYTTAMARRFEYAGTARYSPAQVGTFDLALFGHTGEFQQNRTRAAFDRSSEVQSAHQYVPTDDLGSSLLWTSRPVDLGGTHTLSVGADGRWIAGETRENLLAPTPGLRDAKGQQWLYGTFVQDNYDVTRRIAVSLAVRYDRWQNVAASSREFDAGGVPTANDVPSIPDRASDAFSPKAGLRIRASEWLAFRAAAYRSFRAPTLDELYRPFQVGPTRTEANANLGPETLRGAETGFDLGLAGVSTRVTGFWNEIDNPITNVTCSAPGVCPIGSGSNLRQRENLGTARIRGVEASASWTFLRRWSLGASYTYAENEITDAPGQQLLVGKRLPQDPVNVASASMTWSDPRLLTASAQLRYLGKQYEDDQNTLPLGEAYLVDVFASWHMSPRFDLYFAVENLLDRTYLVGRSVVTSGALQRSVDTIGQPRFIHGGVRFRTGG
jgi:iron complex outermembrane receptor protein